MTACKALHFPQNMEKSQLTIFMNASGSTAIVGMCPEFTFLWNKYITKIRRYKSFMNKIYYSLYKIS